MKTHNTNTPKLGRRMTPRHPHLNSIGYYLWRVGAHTSHGFFLNLDDALRTCRVENLRGGSSSFPVDVATGREVLST